MRAILIDPFTRSITEIEIDPTLNNMYETLGVDLITVVSIKPDHALIIDDEGFLKSKESQEYFWWAGADQPFAGRGLILGDKYGENKDATMTLDQVNKCIQFVDKTNMDPEQYIDWQITTF